MRDRPFSIIFSRSLTLAGNVHSEALPRGKYYLEIVKNASYNLASLPHYAISRFQPTLASFPGSRLGT